MFFAYCSSHLHAPHDFCGDQLSLGLHIPTRVEHEDISTAGRHLLDRLRDITAEKVFQDRPSECPVDRASFGQELFSQLWAMLTPVQKQHIKNGREAPLDAEDSISADHPFEMFLAAFRAGGDDQNVHLLERIFSRIIDTELSGVSGEGSEGTAEKRMQRAYFQFENILTGSDQKLICPTPRWYVRLTQSKAEHGDEPEDCETRPVYAEMSESGQIFDVKYLEQDMERIERKELVDAAKTSRECPLFTHGDPNAFVVEWNKKHPSAWRLKAIPQGDATISSRVDNRKTLYHYSGHSVVVKQRHGRSPSAYFLTVIKKGELSFLEWCAENNVPSSRSRSSSSSPPPPNGPRIASIVGRSVADALADM
jgi:hypothetical protein